MSQPITIKSTYIKHVLILPLLLAFAILSNLQASQLKSIQINQDGQTNINDSVYTYVEKMPEFPGGEKALVRFLSQTIIYPAEAQKKNEHGKVFIQFIVSKTGKVEKAKVIKSVSPDLDNEALRVIGLLPAWTPGVQNGEKVAVQRIIPILFQSAPPKDPNAWEPNEKTLILIDNVKMPSNFNLSILNPDKLASFTVLKPIPKEEKSKLMSKYGNQAADGVILIISKKKEIEYALADTTSNKQKSDSIGCKDATINPEFQGGEAKLMSYLADSIQYPFAAKQLKTQGKVFVRFLVDKTGKISHVEIIRRLDYFLDREALRVINSMPEWIPGSQCGQKTDTYVSLPVVFKLKSTTTTSEKGLEKNNKTVILLDGVRLPSTFNLEWLNYANLTSYQVLQPDTKEITKKLVSLYGNDAVHGVILIGSRK